LLLEIGADFNRSASGVINLLDASLGQTFVGLPAARTASREIFQLPRR
jgi:hypothetical protein